MESFIRELSVKIINEYIFNIYIVSYTLILFLFLIGFTIIQILGYEITSKESSNYFLNY